MRQFPASPITALIDQSPRYNLGESLGPDLSVADVLDPGELASLSRTGGCNGCGPRRVHSAARGSTRTLSDRQTSSVSTTGWPSGGRWSHPVRGSATALMC